MTKKYSENLDAMLERAGGFGIFQVFAVVLLTIMRNSGMYMYYGFGYLTMEQSYLCGPSGNVPCSASQICQAGGTLPYKVDQSSPNYLSNWVQQMDLMCLSRDAINWILTVHYLAYGLAGLIF